MIPQATEAARYHYPELTRESNVVDVGAYVGQWAKDIWKKYRCNVLALEPVREFYQKACENLKDTPVIIENAGLGGWMRTEQFGVQNDSSGILAGSEKKETVTILPVSSHLRSMVKGSVDLIKINVEGMEYEMLDAILMIGDATYFRNLQIQFHHNLPDFQERYDRIAAALSLTHELTWRTPFVWENWHLKQKFTYI